MVEMSHLATPNKMRAMPIVVDPIGYYDQSKGITDTGQRRSLVQLLDSPLRGAVLALVEMDSTSSSPIKQPYQLFCTSLNIWKLSDVSFVNSSNINTSVSSRMCS